MKTEPDDPKMWAEEGKTSKKSENAKLTLLSEKDQKEVKAKYKAKMPEIKEVLSEDDL